MREHHIETLKQDIHAEWRRTAGDSEIEAEIERHVYEAILKGDRKAEDLADKWTRIRRRETQRMQE